MNNLRVAVLAGGPDAERNVSIDSGTAVADALKSSSKYCVNFKVVDKLTLSDLIGMNADVIFPVLHGPYGEGGPLQELLEQSGIPFVGSGSLAARNAMDKVVTKEIAKSAGLNTPKWCTVTNLEPCDLDAPLVLKPVDDGSSIDMAICKTNEEVIKARKQLHNKRESLLAETYIEGDEVTVGIVDGDPLPIIKIIPPEDIRTYDFAAKYERDDTKFIIEPELPPNDCVESSLHLYKTMNIQDIARVDFIINSGVAWFLELNTMPGFTNHSLIPMAAKHAGMSMPEICTNLVELAAARVIK